MLEEERSRSTFNKEQLSRIIYGTNQKLREFVEAQKIVDNNDVMRFNPEYVQSARKVNMLAHAKKLIAYHQSFEFNYTTKNRQAVFFSESMPLSLHFYMFIITLDNLCTEKQREQFFVPALYGKILGCYAQTQLGHGSDVQSLQTTATFSEQDQTFILDMPEVGAVKWWIGDLGIYANHTILFANLIIKGKKYGTHAFLVPLRDNNHVPYPGVEVGDIGPKYGYNCKDNGYLKLSNYKIPRKNMLMKYAKVSSTGQYSRRGNQKISYATMLMIRSGIPFSCCYGLAKASLIAVRYSLYRTQFKNDERKQIPLLDYQLQQDKVIPRIAECFANLFGTTTIADISIEVFEEAQKRNKFDRLNEAHCLASGLKVIFTNDALAGAQILRRSLGGHGFSSYSGLPGIISQLGPTPTYQGQNTILLLQVARFLIKSLGAISKGKDLPPTVQYLRESFRETPFVADFQNVADAFSPENLRQIYMYHSVEVIKKVALKMQGLIGEGQNPKNVWDFEVGVDLKEAGLSYTYFWVFETFQTKLYTATKNQKVRQVLTRLLLLYGAEKIIVRSAQFFSSGVITGNTLRILQQAKQQLLRQIRPDALSIIEGFQYSDNSLHSAIGVSKADPYETLLKWARDYNEVNKPHVRAQLNKLWIETRDQLKEIKAKL